MGRADLRPQIKHEARRSRELEDIIDNSIMAKAKFLSTSGVDLHVMSEK